MYVYISLYIYTRIYIYIYIYPYSFWYDSPKHKLGLFDMVGIVLGGFGDACGTHLVALVEYVGTCERLLRGFGKICG